MDKPIKIERITMVPSKLPTGIDIDKVSVRFGIAFAEHKSKMLVRAILDELKNRNVPEAFIVNPEFVEQAIREKLELGNINYDRLRELVEADQEGAVHIGSCGFCEYYQMDKFCCCPDWVEDSYAIARKPKDYCTKFKKASWVDEVWGKNGCPSCPGYKPKKAEQEGRT